jgi:CPA2 family monovalent cation:H+ antiporter-2
MLASHALALVGVPMRRVLRRVQDQRDARYGLLRGYFHGADDDTADELQHARLLSVTAAAEGRQPRPDARRAGPAASRRQRRLGAPGLERGAPAEDGLRLAAGDTLVLSGLPEPLALAEEKLLRSG